MPGSSNANPQTNTRATATAAATAIRERVELLTGPSCNREPREAMGPPIRRAVSGEREAGPLHGGWVWRRTRTLPVGPVDSLDALRDVV